MLLQSGPSGKGIALRPKHKTMFMRRTAKGDILAILFLLFLFVLLFGMAGCTRNHYRRSADREVGKIISEKAPQVPNMDPRFTIEQVKTEPLDGLPILTNSQEAFGPEAGLEIGSKILSLEKALEIAVEYSRTYQTQKELVFLQALSLTAARHRFDPIFSGGGRGTYQIQSVQVQEEIERIVGGQVIRETRLAQEHQHSANGFGTFGFDKLFRSGGRLAADFTTDFLRFLTGDPRWITSSRVGASFTQPLLRGAGYRVTMENLTQAERDMLYDLRNFVQFRRDFSVQIASSYYQVLQNKDQVRNAWIGLQNFRQNVAREQALAEEARSTLTALGQLQQAELSTELQWINAVRAYRQGLDQFKILLGLPTDSALVLDDRELANLEIRHPEISIDQAVKLALATRLDLQNERDEVEDAARRIDVAANGLLPDLNLILTADLNSESGNRPLSFDLDQTRWTGGLDLDLPLDRKGERNTYRASLISYEQSKRALQLAVDQVKLDILDGWRALDQAKRSYEIAEIGVELSERRVEQQQLLTELGLGTARDLVEAREDLIDALNQRTSALVRHTIARLQFWRDMGMLNIKENGQWEEATNAENE
jgi:outer membrane protein TolC